MVLCSLALFLRLAPPASPSDRQAHICPLCLSDPEADQGLGAFVRPFVLGACEGKGRTDARIDSDFLAFGLGLLNGATGGMAMVT